MQFYCFQFLVTNRQEPSHVGISPKTSEMCQPTRGGHDGGGGGITNFLLNYLPLQMQFFSKIHIGLVWLFGFLVFTRFIKITIRSDSLIVP